MTLLALGLGSNKNEPRLQIDKAIVEIKKLSFFKVLKVSPYYESKPQEVEEQDDFINAAILIDTSLPLRESFSALKDIENRIGNDKPFRYGPRKIDIDILLFDNQIVNFKDLIVPHPKMHMRDFVLKPLLDIFAEGRHPLFKKTVSELFNNLPNVCMAKSLI